MDGWGEGGNRGGAGLQAPRMHPTLSHQHTHTHTHARAHEQIRFLGFALNASATVQPKMAWLMAGGFNYEGGFDERLDSLDVHAVALAPGEGRRRQGVGGGGVGTTGWWGG